jgi:4-amino-4-deoxy-L-arabinose transferase-like glycosyltransferase
MMAGRPPSATSGRPIAEPRSPDPRRPRSWDRSIALALALATAVALGATQSSVGFVRDEGVYFEAAHSYAAWFDDLWDALRRGRPAQAFADPAIVHRFGYNHEHPVLAKVLFGLSHRLFTEKLGWLGDAAGYRLPAWAFAGLLSALLYLMAARLVSRRGGLFAVGAFWLVPRHFFHGHLACFDLPMAALWLLVVYCYWRSLPSTVGPSGPSTWGRSGSTAPRSTTPPSAPSPRSPTSPGSRARPTSTPTFSATPASRSGR